MRSWFLSTLALALFGWVLFRMPLPPFLAKMPGAAPDAEESRALREEATALRRHGKWERALRVERRLHDAYPGDPTYMAELGEIYDHLGRFAEEAAIWAEFFDHSPTPLEGCPQAGQAYEKLGRQREAIAVFERCLSFQPDLPDSLFYLAHAFERDGNIGRAAELYEHGWKLFPANGDLATGLARMRLRQGQPEEARRLAGDVLRAAGGKNSDALLVAGLAARRLGDRAAALDYLRRGAALAPRDEDFKTTLAQMAAEDAGRDRP